MLAWPSWLMAIGNIGNWWNDLMDTSIYRKPCAFLYLKKHTCHNNIKDMRHELSYSWLNCIYFGVYYFYHYHYRYYHHYHYWALLFCFLLSILQLYSFTSLAQSCRPLTVPQHRCNGARHELFLDSFRLALSKLDRYPGTSSTPYRIKKGTETWGKGQLADFLSPFPLWGCHDSYPMLLGIRRRNRHGQCCTMYGTFTNKKEHTKPFVGPSRMKTSDSKVFTDPKMISQGTIKWCIWIFLQDYPLFHHKDTEIALKQPARP